MRGAVLSTPAPRGTAEMESAMRSYPTIESRFWAKVDIRDGCWNWLAHVGRNGYGTFKYPTTPSAHRIAYELVYGPIPLGLTIDHLCFNKQCVRPDHLEAVTQRVNGMRADTPWSVNARKPHCSAGHEYSPENTYRYRNMRMCRRCRYIAVKKQREEAK